MLTAQPFSFDEVLGLPTFDTKPPSYIAADDGCELAYYPYTPDNARGICIFYHGAGFYGDQLHQRFAKELADQHGIATYIVDIRGHGNSGGERGDAPSIEAVWNDVSCMVQRVRQDLPHLPIYLAGHSSGAGLLLNYAAWVEREPVDGLILLAPYLGPQSGVLKTHVKPEQEFAKSVRTWVYIVGGMSGGYLCGNTAAVYFNYPFDLLKDDAIVRYYTYNMSMATTPYESNKVLSALTLPTTVLIASDDEQFDAHLLADQVNQIPNTTWKHTEIVQAKHLTILLQASDLIASSVDRIENESTTPD